MNILEIANLLAAEFVDKRRTNKHQSDKCLVFDFGA